MSQDNRPYNQLKHGSEVCDGTTNQTNRLSHQQRQDSTVNIFNIQLYTFIITFGKHKFIQKKKKNDDRNIKTLNMTMTTVFSI